MLFLRDGQWYCDCERPLDTDYEKDAGLCAQCAASGVQPPSKKLIDLVQAGRVLDMRDDRWRSGCPK